MKTAKCLFDLWSFHIQPHGIGFVLLVKTHAGMNPVGPRLLRGGHLSEEFLTSTYDTIESADRARSAWESYRESNIDTVSGRAIAKKRKA